MISERCLALATERGILTVDQAARLRELEVAVGGKLEDAEPLRFVTGVGGIFVSVGLVLFLSAAAYFVWLIGGMRAAGAAVGVLSWLLAEFFTRRRKMDLPSIVLVVTFTTGIFALAALQGELYLGDGFNLGLVRLPPAGAGLQRHLLVGIAAAMIAAAATAIHYARFRVPISIAAIALVLLAVVCTTAYSVAPTFTIEWYRALLFAWGLGVLGLALLYDRTDPHRSTQRAEVALWLHLLAAALIVHATIGAMISGHRLDSATAVGVLATFLVLGLVSVLIDRRALLLAGLLYAGVAGATLLKQTGLAGNAVPATLLIAGLFVLLLSAGWQTLRRTLLGLLPIASQHRRI